MVQEPREIFKLTGYFQIQRIAFGVIGLNPISMDHPISNFVLLFLTLGTAFALSALGLHDCFMNIRDVDIVTDTISPISQLMLCFSKVIIFVSKRKDITRLVHRLWHLNLQAREMELKIIIEENRKDITFNRSFYTSALCCGFVAVFAPPAVALYKYMANGDQFQPTPPFRASYFLDTTTPINIFIIYVFTATLIFYNLHGTVALEGIFSWVTHNMNAQLRITQMLVQQAAMVHEGEAAKQCATLRFIRYHRKTLELADNMNHAFGMIVFMQTGISCLVTCALTFRFTRGGNLSDELFRLTFLVVISLQLLMYCYCGQRIQNESEQISTEIYDAYQWQIVSPKMRKLLLLPLQRAQRPCSLNGIFFVADLSLFLWVLRRAGSFITLLLTIVVETDDNDALTPSLI